MPRPSCKNCTRPLSECYCGHLVTIDNSIDVLIIQHPSETDHPYNTGRMANLCLSRSELVVQEQIPPSIQARIQANKTVLLFPELEWLSNTESPPEQPELLVAIDASWNKAKRILHSNPWLQQLPRLSLKNPEPSRYRAIRKSSLDHSLSTIEALANGLSQLDSQEDYSALLRPLDRLIEQVRRHQSAN